MHPSETLMKKKNIHGGIDLNASLHSQKKGISCHWGCTFSKSKLLSILGANMYIFGVNTYILGANMFIS